LTGAPFRRRLSNRDDFLGIVSHDLRNLLGGLMSVALAERAGRHVGERSGREGAHPVTPRA
jgi:hypothetical protein